MKNHFKTYLPSLVALVVSLGLAAPAYAANPSLDSIDDQYESDGSTVISGGGYVSDPGGVMFKATVSDPDPIDDLYLEVEVERNGTGFNGVAGSDSEPGLLCTPTPVFYDGTPLIAEITCTGFVLGESYQWQVRAVDIGGSQSHSGTNWVANGGSPDFIYDSAPSTVDSIVGQFESDGTTPIAVNGYTIDATGIIFKAMVSDGDPIDDLSIEIDIEENSVGFDDTPGSSTEPGIVCTPTPVFYSGISIEAESLCTGFTIGNSYHWQVRVVDIGGSESAWSVFDAPATPDFNFKSAPPAIDSITGQYESDGTTNIVVDGYSTDPVGIMFKAMVSDGDAIDDLTLEIEIEPVGTSFDDVPGSTAEPGIICMGFPVFYAGAPLSAEVSCTGFTYGNSYHWQLRVVDISAETSAWSAFGGNTDNDPGVSDTDLNYKSAPPAIDSITGQYESDGTTNIVVDGYSTDPVGIMFKAVVSDGDAIDDLTLEIEIEPVDTPFDDIPGSTAEPGILCIGFPVFYAGAPLEAEVSCTGFTYGVSYHWQVRVVDISAEESAWSAFGGNTDNDPGVSDTDLNYKSAPPAIVSVDGQFNSDGSTTVTEQGYTNDALGMIFKATINDGDVVDDLTLEVEIEPEATAFNGTTGSDAEPGILCIGTPAFYTGSNLQAEILCSGLTEGVTYHWQIRVVDIAGEVSHLDGAAWAQFGSFPDDFTPDYTKPTTVGAGALTLTPEFGTYVGGSYTIETIFTDVVSGIDAGTGCQYTVNNSDWFNTATTDNLDTTYTCSKATTCTDAASLSINTRATDRATNGPIYADSTEVNTPAARTCDAAAPVYTGWVSPADNSYYRNETPNNTFTLTINANDGTGVDIQNGVDCLVRIDGGDTGFTDTVTYNGSQCTGTVTLENTLGEGSHTVTVAVPDQVANSATSTTRTIYVDMTAPDYEATWTAPTADSFYKNGDNIPINVFITEDDAGITDLTTCDIRVDDLDTGFTEAVTYNSGTGRCIGTITSTSLADGSHVITMNVPDDVTNSAWSASSVSVIIDNTPPTFAAVLPSNTMSLDEAFLDGSFDLSTDFDDGVGSGIDYCEYCAVTDGNGCTNADEWVAATWDSGPGTCTATGITNSTFGPGFVILNHGDGVKLNMRAFDKVGLVAEAVELAAKSIDKSVPTDVTGLNDGASAPDIDFSNDTANQSANWTVSTDSGSGTKGYYACINNGAAPAKGDGCYNWTATNSITTAGTYNNATTWYWHVYAADKVDLLSTNITTSDGVTIDTVAPTVLSANSNSLLQVVVNYTEANLMDQALAEVPGNYDIMDQTCTTTQGLTIDSASLTGNAATLTLNSGTPFIDNTWYCVVVTNVTDAAGNPLTADPDDRATFLVDTSAPNADTYIIKGTEGTDTYTNTNVVDVQVLCNDGAAGTSTGCSQMGFSNDDSAYTWYGVTEDVLATQSWTLTAGDGTKTMYLKLRDNAGNETASGITETIELDTSLPTGTVVIDSDNAYTPSQLVDLTTLMCIDTGGVIESGCAFMDYSNDNSVWNGYEAYGGIKSGWDLGAVDGLKTVYVRYRDTAGNVSALTITDTITLDTTAPTSGTVLPANIEYNGTHVAGTFDISTTFADGTGSGVFSCEYCTATDGGCSTSDEWVGATWGAGTCSITGLTDSTTTDTALVDGDTVYINMRATDNVAWVGEATVETRAVDKIAPSDVPAVNDGPGADIDFSGGVGATTSQDANWTAATDLAGAANSGIKGYYACINNGAAPAKGDGCYNFTATNSITTGGTYNDGTTYYWHVYAEDNVDNLSSGIATSDGVTIDITPPDTFDILTPSSGTITNDNTPTYSWDASFDANGLQKYKVISGGGIYNNDNIDPGLTSTTQVVPLPDSIYTWYVEAYDNAGNVRQSTQTTWTIHVDTKGPKVINAATLDDDTKVDVYFEDTLGGAGLDELTLYASSASYKIYVGSSCSGTELPVTQVDTVVDGQVKLTTAAQEPELGYTVCAVGTVIKDLAGNTMSASNSAPFNGFITEDNLPPNKITDLSVKRSYPHAILLEWTAPNDDNAGTEASPSTSPDTSSGAPLYLDVRFTDATRYPPGEDGYNDNGDNELTQANFEACWNTTGDAVTRLGSVYTALLTHTPSLGEGGDPDSTSTHWVEETDTTYTSAPADYIGSQATLYSAYWGGGKLREAAAEPVPYDGDGSRKQTFSVSCIENSKGSAVTYNTYNYTALQTHVSHAGTKPSGDTTANEYWSTGVGPCGADPLCGTDWAGGQRYYAPNDMCASGAIDKVIMPNTLYYFSVKAKDDRDSDDEFNITECKPLSTGEQQQNCAPASNLLEAHSALEYGWNKVSLPYNWDKSGTTEGGPCGAAGSNATTLAQLFGDDIPSFRAYLWQPASSVVEYPESSSTFYTARREHMSVLTDDPIVGNEPGTTKGARYWTAGGTENQGTWAADKMYAKEGWVSVPTGTGISTLVSQGYLANGKGFYASARKNNVMDAYYTGGGTNYGVCADNTVSEVIIPLYKLNGIEGAGGWNLVGNPFLKNIRLEEDYVVGAGSTPEVEVCDTSTCSGGTVYSFEDAVTAGWVDSGVFYGTSGDLEDLDQEACNNSVGGCLAKFRPWWGQWVIVTGSAEVYYLKFIKPKM